MICFGLFAWFNWNALIKQVTPTMTCLISYSRKSTSCWFSGRVLGESPPSSLEKWKELFYMAQCTSAGRMRDVTALSKTLGCLRFVKGVGPLEMMESPMKLGIYEPTTMMRWNTLQQSSIVAGKRTIKPMCLLVDAFSSRQPSCVGPTVGWW